MQRFTAFPCTCCRYIDGILSTPDVLAGFRINNISSSRIIRERYDEKDLKDALVDKGETFLMELGTYVVAVNHQMKTEHDNQTLGLLVCKDMDKVEAQYALESSSQPLGISRYELTRLIPEDFKGSMPTIEEIEAELADPEGGQDA